MNSAQRKIACLGALLLSLGMFTGLWTGMVMNGTFNVKIPHLALATHLNALLGSFWIFAVSYTVPFLRYNTKQLKVLTVLVAVPAYGNWAITLAASALGVRGLSYDSDPANNAIAFLLQVVVVLPSLLASIYWMRGFCRRAQ